MVWTMDTFDNTVFNATVSIILQWTV